MKRVILTNILICLALTGCGSSSKSDSRAVVAFDAISTSRLPARISGLTYSIYLPSGVSVDTGATAGLIDSGSLTAGSAVTDALGSSSLVFGSYSASINRVKIGVADASLAQSGFSPGEVARLTCTVHSGTSFTVADIVSLNTPLPPYRVTGFDTTTSTTVDLTSLIRPKFRIVSNN